MTASPNYLPGGRQNIDVELYKAQPYGPEIIRQATVRAYPGETEDQLYTRVVDEAQKMIIASIGRETSNAVADNISPQSDYVGLAGNISAQINFASMQEWVQTKQSLERITGSQNIQVRSMSPRSAILDIQHQGNVENLRNILAQAGLTLNYPPVGQIYQINRAIPAQIY